MKIGIDISQIVFEGSGVATYTRLLTSNLMKSGDDDEFVLFGSSFRNRRPLSEFVHSLTEKNFKTKFFFLPPKALEFLWNGIHVFPIENLIGPVDVFHSSDWLEPPTKQAKKVTTIHDLTIFKYPNTFVARGGHNIVLNQKRKLFFVKQYCDKIIAVSETTKQDIMDILKIPEKKIKVIYEAADPDFSPRDAARVQKVKEKFTISGRYLLCVGAREPRKNLDRLIAAFVEVASANPDLSLVIVGKYGWGEDVTGDRLSVISGRLKVLGFVEKDDLGALYSGATGFIYPSLYEGFGLPILEAMACGCPVITSNIGSMKEIAGGSALLVEPEEIESIAGAISKICRNKKVSDELKIKGFKRAGEFNWQKAALQTLEAYHSLLE